MKTSYAQRHIHVLPTKTILLRYINNSRNAMKLKSNQEQSEKKGLKHDRVRKDS